MTMNTCTTCCGHSDSSAFGIQVDHLKGVKVLHEVYKVDEVQNVHDPNIEEDIDMLPWQK